MTRKAVVLATKLCGVALAGVTAAAAVYATELVHQRPLSAQTTQLIDCGLVLLIAVSVRLIVYGTTIGKRATAALLLSLLLSVLIGVAPSIGDVWTNGISTDFYAGLWFMSILFIAPSVCLAVVLAVVPIFDRGVNS